MLYVPVSSEMLLNEAISLKLFSSLVCDNMKRNFWRIKTIIENIIDWLLISSINLRWRLRNLSSIAVAVGVATKSAKRSN